MTVENGFVPAESIPMPEAVTDAELEEKLRRQLTLGLPGFLLKHELGIMPTPAEAIALHDEHVYRIVLALRRLHPNKIIQAKLNEAFRGFGNEAVGVFHNDAVYTGQGTQLLVHTTTLGYGDVYAAAPGRDVQRIMNYRLLTSKVTAPDSPHALLQERLVDPELVSPQIYTGYARPGYTFVLMEQGQYSSWHRFDTDRQVCSDREVCTSIISDERPNHIDPLHYDFGLDLAA